MAVLSLASPSEISSKLPGPANCPGCKHNRGDLLFRDRHPRKFPAALKALQAAQMRPDHTSAPAGAPDARLLLMCWDLPG